MGKAKTLPERATRKGGKRAVAGATPVKPRAVSRNTAEGRATAGATPATPNLDDKRRSNDKYTPAQVIAALEASAGIYNGAAQMLRCSHSTVGYYVDRYADVKEALNRILEERLDVAEGILLTTMTKSKSEHAKLTATIFYLKTKGKHRGYTERQELTGKDGAAIEHRNFDPIDLSAASEDDLDQLDRLLSRIQSAVSG